MPKNNFQSFDYDDDTAEPEIDPAEISEEDEVGDAQQFSNPRRRENAADRSKRKHGFFQ